MHMYVHHEHALHMKAGRLCWISWTWSYRWLSAAMWVLEMEPWSSGKVASALSHQVIAPALCQILEMRVMLDPFTLCDLLLTSVLFLKGCE